MERGGWKRQMALGQKFTEKKHKGEGEMDGMTRGWMRC